MDKEPRIDFRNDAAIFRNLWEMATQVPEHISLIEKKHDSPLVAQFIEEKLNKLIKRRELFFPNLQAHNDTVLVLSDYGGENSTSRYKVISFLICGYSPLLPFSEAQDVLRREHKLNAPVKEFAFKSMDYGPQARALPGYLRNLNNLVPGMLVSVVIEKGISLWGADKKSGQQKIVKLLKSSGLGNWKPEVAEKLVTTVHLISYFLALLASDGQKIFWQSDHDAIMANDDKTLKTGGLFTSTLNYYTDKKFNIVGFGKSFGKDSPLFLDLLSAPDLVAGSIEHYMTRDDDPAELTLKDGANQVLVWHGYQGIMLKKYAFVFRAGNCGQLSSGILSFNVKTPPADAMFINIPPGKRGA